MARSEISIFEREIGITGQERAILGFGKKKNIQKPVPDSRNHGGHSSDLTPAQKLTQALNQVTKGDSYIPTRDTMGQGHKIYETTPQKPGQKPVRFTMHKDGGHKNKHDRAHYQVSNLSTGETTRIPLDGSEFKE